jgi:aminoglycoside phosphotransferase (APT) family kinase protein
MERGVGSGRQGKVTTDRIDGLAGPIAACLGLERVRIEPAPGGAGNLAFHVFDPAGAERPVAFLRVAPGDGGRHAMGYTLAREGAILRTAAALGFPVAPVLATFDDPDALLMAMVPGTSRPDPAEIERVGPAYMALIARVHATDPAPFPLRQFATVDEAVDAELELWRADGEATGVSGDALMALAVRVLTETRPRTAGRPSLVHGDVGAGNFLSERGEVTAMLDWEMAHLGDPHEDLAWMWMRGAHTDFGDPQQRMADYAAASGADIDRARLDWHLAFVMWKSVQSMLARLRAPVPGELGMIPLIITSTYGALLASQLVRVLGGSLPLLQQTPERVATPEANLADELLTVADLTPAERVVVEHLRDAAAQSAWEQRCLARECRAALDIEVDALAGHARACPPAALRDVAVVVGRHADRRATADERAVRRIRRAQRVGLGNG